MYYKPMFFCLLVAFIASAFYIYITYIDPYRKLVPEYNSLTKKSEDLYHAIIDQSDEILELEKRIGSLAKSSSLPPDSVRDQRIKSLEAENRMLKSNNALLLSLLRSETFQRNSPNGEREY